MVDTDLKARAAEDRPIRVGLVGAGATGRAIALHLSTPVPGIWLAGIANRTVANGERAFRDAGVPRWTGTDQHGVGADSIRRRIPVLTDDPRVLVRNPDIDVIVEATGTIDYAAGVVLEAIENRKHVVLVNVELDSLLGPILKAKADAAGVVLTNTDGDEPGVAMTLVRYLRGIGLRVVAAGNIKGMVDHYRTPDTQREFADRYGLDAWKVTSFADATKLSMEATVLANATGFGVARRGMCGPACGDVRELAKLLPTDAMLDGGIVDYSLGAEPRTGAFAVVHEENHLKRAQLAYYRMGDGPFYVFHTPFHLAHVQVASSIGRAALFGDPTVTPLDRPHCEVVAMAKRDLRGDERIDGVGGFCTYGLIDNAPTARAMSAVPMALAEGCTVVRDVQKDSVLTTADLRMPPERLRDRLWREQQGRWPVGSAVPARGVTAQDLVAP